MSTEDIFKGFLQTLAEDPWVDTPVKNAARTALAQFEPAPAEQTAAPAEASKPQARASSGRASGGGR